MKREIAFFLFLFVVFARGLSQPIVHTTPDLCYTPECDGFAWLEITDTCYLTTYHWSNGGTGEMASGLCPGQHWVVAIGPCACDTIFFTIGVDAPIVTLSKTDVYCDKQGTLDAFVTGGYPPYSYIWKDQLGNTVGTSQKVSSVPTGVYTVFVTDSKGCTATGSIEVKNGGNPVSVKITGLPIDCNSKWTALEAFPKSNQSILFTYKWTNEQGQIVSTAKYFHSINKSGIYTVTVTDGNGCTATASYTVTFYPQLDIFENVGNTTCGENNGVVVFTIPGGGNATLKLTNVQGDVFPHTIGNKFLYENLPAGMYKLLVISGEGCPFEKTFVIEDSAPLQDTVICDAGCEPMFVDGIWFEKTGFEIYTETVGNCIRNRVVRFVLLEPETQNLTYNQCWGQVVSIGGNEYSSDTVVTLSGPNCSGDLEIELIFSPAPDIIQLQDIHWCGLKAEAICTQLIEFDAGCPSKIFQQCIFIDPIEDIVVDLPTEYRCGTRLPETFILSLDEDLAQCQRTVTKQTIVYREVGHTSQTVYTCDPAQVGSVIETIPVPGLDCDSTHTINYLPFEKPQTLLIKVDTCASGIPDMEILHADYCTQDTIFTYNTVDAIFKNELQLACVGDTIVWGPYQMVAVKDTSLVYDDGKECPTYFTLQVLVDEPTYKYEDIKACFGDPIVVNGVVYTTNDHFVIEKECAVVEYNIEFGSAPDTISTLEISCEYGQDTVFYTPLKNDQNGCTSLVEKREIRFDPMVCQCRVRILPNPIASGFSPDVEISGMQEEVNITVTDAMGSIKVSYDLAYTGGLQKFNLSGFPSAPGTYFLRFTDHGADGLLVHQFCLYVIVIQ